MNRTVSRSFGNPSAACPPPLPRSGPTPISPLSPSVTRTTAIRVMVGFMASSFGGFPQVQPAGLASARRGSVSTSPSHSVSCSRDTSSPIGPGNSLPPVPESARTPVSAVASGLHAGRPVSKIKSFVSNFEVLQPRACLNHDGALVDQVVAQERRLLFR